MLLSQITSRAKSAPYSIALDPSDFDIGGLNRQSHIRPNRLFTADSRIVLYATGRVRHSKLREAVNTVISILNAQ
jgi:mRNA interferase MazF